MLDGCHQVLFAVSIEVTGCQARALLGSAYSLGDANTPGDVAPLFRKTAT